MTPWKYSKHAAMALLAIVITIYVSFADVSVIKGMSWLEILYAGTFSGLIIFALTKFKNLKVYTKEPIAKV